MSFYVTHISKKNREREGASKGDYETVEERRGKKGYLPGDQDKKY